jgi:hypothetical protein
LKGTNVPDLFKPSGVGGRRSTEAFEASLFAWWISMQPASRFKDDPLPSTLPLPQPPLSSNTTWKLLNRGGINGFSIVLLGMSWWAAVKPTGASLRKLKMLVEDVDYVLRGMILTYEAPNIGE